MTALDILRDIIRDGYLSETNMARGRRFIDTVSGVKVSELDDDAGAKCGCGHSWDEHTFVDSPSGPVPDACPAN